MDVFRNGENVTDYVIGTFNDLRLARTGALLFKNICNKLTTCIKRLAGNRAMEVGFGRFLRNDNVSIEEIEKGIAEKTNANCLRKIHVLCIQDTVESSYPKQAIKKINFGPTTNKDVKGFFIHPGIIVDAENRDILGISSVKAWIRREEEVEPRDKRPIEEKESMRWIETAQKASDNIKNVHKITVIGDRESDIYELFDRIPDDRTDILVRARHDRNLLEGSSLSEHMNEVKSVGRYKIELPEITGKRKARVADIEIKFSTVSLARPGHGVKGKKTIKISCVEVQEIGDVPKGEEAVFWRLLTTHKITNFEKAKQIVVWYTWRWIIEQIFRTMKKKGLHIEDSQIETPKELLKMFILGLAAAIHVLCLVYARDGKTKRPATDIFSNEELIVLLLLLKKTEGKTEKQTNPYKKDTLSWATWIIARLGGWNGYQSERPPGPITMFRGLQKFNSYFQGWLLAQEDVCIP